MVLGSWSGSCFIHWFLRRPFVLQFQSYLPALCCREVSPPEPNQPLELYQNCPPGLN